MLQVLWQHRNAHLTKHLATWTHRGKYYMLFPLAKYNLHDYMEKVVFNQTKEDQIWLLEQLCGLASALLLIHQLAPDNPAVDQDSKVNSDSNLSPNPLHQEKERKAGWHHDVKPQNILYFEDVNLGHKIFQIADFGSSKIHIFRSRSHPTRTPRGTLTYEPPELEMEGETSRPHDVWSLGCVFLKVLIWAAMGFASLEKFKNDGICKRTPEGAPDDGFWSKQTDGTVALRDSVQLWIRTLYEKVQDQPRHSFSELLDVIASQILEIDRKKRIEADQVYLEMNRILAQQKAVLEQDDSKGSETSPVCLLPSRSLTSSPRRSSTTRSFPEGGPVPLKKIKQS